VISETKFFAIVFSGNPRWKRNRRSKLRLSRAAFSHLRKERAAQSRGTRRITGSPQEISCTRLWHAKHRPAIANTGKRIAKKKGPANRAF